MPSYPHLILNILCLHKDLHATTEVPPEPCLNAFVWRLAGSRVAHSAGVGELPRQGACRGCRGCPCKGLAGETCFARLHFVALAHDVTLFVLCPWLLSGSPPLPCYVWLWRVALTARAQVKGSKGEPLLLYTDIMFSMHVVISHY